VLIGFSVCWALIPLIRRIATPRPGEQESHSFHHTHKGHVPRFGGVALACAFLGVALLASFFATSAKFQTDIVVVLSCLAMFALGVRDDVRPLGAKIKLLAQLGIATGIYLCGLQIEVLNNPFTGKAMVLGVWALPVTVFWVVALTNLINLIDGMDGLAGGICLMLMCLLAYAGLGQTDGTGYSFATLLSAGMAAALIGFLCFNFPPARIYMGDGGAYFLGCLIAVLTISTSHKGTVAAGLIAPLFALALPIADVTFAILRRGLSGLPIFRPDRKHIHHRLIQSGLSRRRAVLTLYAISMLCVLMAFAVFWTQGKLVPILFGVMSLVVFSAARLMGFFRNFWEVRKILGSSFQLRRESRYALAMMAWLEMEAERCEALQELWTSYLFFTRKLGFAHVRLVLNHGTDFVWKSHSAGPDKPDWHRARHDIALANIRAIEFSAAAASMSKETFQHLAELAAEAWIKAAHRWKEASGESISFEPAIPQVAPVLAPGRVLVANAA
jgi:UDP-GlcNAc:undecaprenyl-phosphate GlcNAc-1-phosphate transferase